MPKLSKPAIRDKQPISGTAIPWRERMRLPVNLAAQIAGVSPASLYKFESQGRLAFRRLGGRTVVVTESLIALIENDEAWAASERGSAARAKRSERSSQAWA